VVQRYLIDTHIFLWLVSTPWRLPEMTSRRLAAPGVRLLVSSVSAMEIATKVRLDKLPEALPLVTDSAWKEVLCQLRADELSITTRHSLLAGSLAWSNRDPFDRILAAQAILEDVPLISADSAFVSTPGLTVVWKIPEPH
jgi:PIN domain nuclease of toxin-antitoxin system